MLPMSEHAGIRSARLLSALVLVGVASSCATTHPDEALHDAGMLAGARGAPMVVWRIDAEPGAPPTDAVQTLLARPLDADTAVAIAVERNPELRATLERAGIAQADLAQATRISGLTLGGSWLSGSGDAHKTSWNVGFELLDILIMPLRKRVAEAAVQQAKLEIGQAVLDLVAETRTAFARAQASRAVADRLREAAAAEQAAAEFAEALFAAGNLGELERAQARAASAERRAESVRAELDASADREAVQRLLGLRDAAGWTAAPLAPLPEQDPPLAEIDGAASRRLDLEAARFAVETLEHAISAKRKTRFLPVALEVGVEREDEGDRPQITGPTLALRLPLFDTGKASLARLDSELRQARWQLEARVVAARSDARIASAGLRAAREQEELARTELVPQRSRALDLTLRSYNMMLVGAPAVLLAKQTELDAERGAIAAQRDYWIARAELDRALGGGSGVATAEPAKAETKKGGTR